MSIHVFQNRQFFKFPVYFYFFVVLLIIEKCTAYTPPNATVEPLYPKGLRISIPHEPGISLVAYHVKFNEDFYSLEAGSISIDIIKPRNGRWLYEDHRTELKEGDMIYYWVHVVYQGLGYNLLNQEYRVTGFYNYDGTPVRSDTDGATCTVSSVTKVINKDGQSQDSCTGQLILEETFDSLNLSRWTPVERFSSSPDYEFVVYKNSEENLKVSDGRLRITPTYLENKYGIGFVRRGTLILDKCTAVVGSNDCQREAVGSYILPPIMSGQLSSKGKFLIQYGRIEVRAKLPEGDWIYPVISLETDSTDKDYTQPQIRIASSTGNSKLRSKEGTDLSGHVLWAGALQPIPLGDDLHKVRAKLPRRSSADTWSNDYHTYELEWRNDRMLVKVDGITYGEQGIGAPFDQPFYINLGVAVGGRGEFADSCTSSNYKKPWRNVGSKALLDFYEARDNWSKTWNDNKKFLEVDHVKVWAL